MGRFQCYKRSELKTNVSFLHLRLVLRWVMLCLYHWSLFLSITPKDTRKNLSQVEFSIEFILGNLNLAEEDIFAFLYADDTIF